MTTEQITKWIETGRKDYRYCEVERANTAHREERSGLWRCIRCGYASGEDLRDLSGSR